ncbi:MAG: phosphotransferase [Chloroflexota bacterium]|nr:phosphotransferase [Chloroflexota bacterium]MDE2841295.1 phosphotransferase [Chloroflexota bacterium]MDE2931181.1 phosphotransferase [Chloroflexota bacterium]
MLALDKVGSAEIGRYLAARGVLDSATAVTVDALGGGVSNIVLRVTTPSQCLVLKQALPELRVEAYWPSRVDRALREAEALRIVAEHLPSGAVPEVYFIDEENFIYGMSCAPETATLWKEDLLAGRVDVSVAAAAGRLLAQMHAVQEPAVRRRFIDDEVFWQLRVDPYYNTTAEKHPSLQPVFDHAIAQMKTRKLALVHGDYSPKNMFVLREEVHSRSVFSTVARGLVPRPGLGVGKGKKMDSVPRHGASLRGNDGGKAAVGSGSRTKDRAGKPTDGCQPENEMGCTNPILLLDFEVVHWGDPAFDLAFCLNHLLIKSIVNSHIQDAYFQSVTAFIEGYNKTLPGEDWAELAAETRLQLGCLMLARIDGKSPVEYITDEPTKEKVRRVSFAILHEQPSAMTDIYACIVRETAQ